MSVNFQDNENKILKCKNEINKLKNLMRDVSNQFEIMNGGEIEMNRIFDTYYKPAIKEVTSFAKMQTKIMKDLDEARLTLSKLEGY